MGLIIYVLAIVIVACIVIPLIGRLVDCDNTNTDHFVISPTTNMEYITLTIMEILQKNQEKNEDFEKFLSELKRKKIVNTKASDKQFYIAASLAYRNGTLTRDYIKNRLT